MHSSKLCTTVHTSRGTVREPAGQLANARQHFQARVLITHCCCSAAASQQCSACRQARGDAAWLPCAGTRSLPAPAEYFCVCAGTQAVLCANPTQLLLDQVSNCSACGSSDPHRMTRALTPVLCLEQASAQQVRGGAERRTGGARGQERVAVQAGEPEVCLEAELQLAMPCRQALFMGPAACTAEGQFSSGCPSVSTLANSLPESDCR